MEKIQYFFECYFNQSYYFDDLDNLIKEYKKIERSESQLQLITELHQIIQTKSYALAAHIMKKHGSRIFDNLEEAEKFINFLYDRFIDRPTNVKAEDFTKKINVLLCPVCCPETKQVKKINLIEKAIVDQKNIVIFICKACKLVWTTTEISENNSKSYKNFMKSLGLKGTWKELRDIDSNLIDYIQEDTSMDTVKYFFRGYFTGNESFEELDESIQQFKGNRHESKLIAELDEIIKLKKYETAAKIVKIYSKKELNLEKTEKFINFLYNKFVGIPTNLKAEDFMEKV